MSKPWRKIFEVLSCRSFEVFINLVCMYHDSFFCANLITCVQTEYDFVNEACQNSRDFYSVTAFNSISSVRDINPVDSDDALYHERTKNPIAFDPSVTE